MPEQALLDNDVALKVACYSLTDEALAVTTINDTPPAMLGVGRFVIRGRLDRGSNVVDVRRAKAALERLLDAVDLLEPNDKELAIAADLEGEANRRGLELDGGESQLLAILFERACQILITGDKRAITAMAVVAPQMASNRIVCLEQLFAMMTSAVDTTALRARVCAEPQVDRAVTSCFACAQDAVSREDVLAGLASYIGHLDRGAPGMLVPGLAPGHSN